VRKVLTLVGIVLGLAALFVATIFLASESGEVVTLTTYDAAGAPHASRIWVVDDAGAQWLRAGLRKNAWYQRLVAHPEVEVRRGAVSGRYRAVAVETDAARDRVHALMAAKYGLADRYISMIRDGKGSVAVRLDPLP
jgi:hypothetical protein